ncbi:MAG: [FeFe] hydrogenase H-cluster radical SAM maturase HydE [Deltaproteobacteria bacterium]|nr:[FeFe] hydrogenase H-cluster radical SAM maturase HydE [Deltaproteobacteria bacterium]
MLSLIDRLEKEKILTAAEFVTLLENRDEARDYLFARARAVRDSVFGQDIFIRGLLEFTNYCKNDCLYCGIRRGNRAVSRYRLTPEEILERCALGFELGFRTFVLQGGEDPFFTAPKVASIVREIKSAFPGVALTLSLGERSRETYELWRKAGADRYLLRHETRNEEHYSALHPPEMSLASRLSCLFALKEIGYQVGCGFMVGSPSQTLANLAEDLLFVKELSPHMVGIGPFIPHRDTPFRDCPAGDVELTLFLLGLIRLMEPLALLPATTALGSLDPLGREKGVMAGANVLMPILTPPGAREKYLLYDNKICVGDAAETCRFCVQRRMEGIGRVINVSRGDYPGFAPQSP